MCHLTIVRHGETKTNVTGLVQTRTEGELTEQGVLMAQALGRRLETENFTHIFSSDLKRCRDTTLHVVSNLKVAPPHEAIQYTPILRERDYGEWELQSRRLVIEKKKAMKLPPFRGHLVEVPNGETYDECKGRAAQFFCDILKLVDTKMGADKEVNVLAVSHVAYIKCFMDHLRENCDYELVNLTDRDMKKRLVNTCVTRFSICKSKMEGHQYRLTFSNIFDGEHTKSIQREESVQNGFE